MNADKRRSHKMPKNLHFQRRLSAYIGGFSRFEIITKQKNDSTIVHSGAAEYKKH